MAHSCTLRCPAVRGLPRSPPCSGPRGTLPRPSSAAREQPWRGPRGCVSRPELPLSPRPVDAPLGISQGEASQTGLPLTRCPLSPSRPSKQQPHSPGARVASPAYPDADPRAKPLAPLSDPSLSMTTSHRGQCRHSGPRHHLSHSLTCCGAVPCAFLLLPLSVICGPPGSQRPS